jgi:hypothetical protein
LLQQRAFEASQATPARAAALHVPAVLLVSALVTAGFTLTLLVFYPGYMTIDATYIHTYIEGWHYGDWQSPVMSVLWALIDPIAPGAASMFLLTAALYWLGFAVLALALARRSLWLAALPPLLALVPPAFAFVGMIWRDVLFAAVWLVAAAVIFAAADRAGRWRRAAQLLALALIAFGVLLRPNAILAAPLLAAYALWPTRFAWKRLALFYVPAVVLGYALVQVVYYDMLDARRENPLHSIMVFDLGGITYFAGENQFPVSWTPEQDAMFLTRSCYDPVHWDTYWTTDPCRFVMQRLERKDDVIFGTPRLVAAWERAITAHPLAYLEHRAAFLWTFLARTNLTLPLYDSPATAPFAKNRYFTALVSLHDALKDTVLFRPGFWLVLATAFCALGWRARNTPAGAFAWGAAGSGAVYVLSFFPVGVATDFRYAYWCVLAVLAAAVPVLRASLAGEAERVTSRPSA